LLEYVKSLENKNNPERGRQVQIILKSLGIEPSIQESRLLKVRNIVVEFSPGAGGKSLLFSAHFDAVKGSPGANDDASGVAVLLGLCRELKHTRMPIRIVFFDHEEVWLRTPFLRLGLLGSLYYVGVNKLRNIAAVYNLEYCGRGDSLSVWPVKNREKDLPAVRLVEKVAADLKLDCRLAHIPWLFLSSDHLSFRLRGLANAITLSLLPASQVPVLERMIAGLSIKKLLLRKKPPLPEPLSSVHSTHDTSSQLNEDSLQLMLSILLEIVKNHAPQQNI